MRINLTVHKVKGEFSVVFLLFSVKIKKISKCDSLTVKLFHYLF